MKSTRSIAVVIVVFALSLGLFLGKVTGEQYLTIASIIISAYFAKRDEKKPEEELEERKK